MPLFTVAGLLVTSLACLCIYATSPHQRLWATAWPIWPARLAGAGLFAAGWLAFAQDMRTLAATFTWLTLQMLAFALLPYIGALFHDRRTS
ncbi:hypothetical protein [Comamonas terrigena]|uniref:hypothetical protein n=1 Tax=Comamonas terrigena TaxID=32013 RepID=UPI00244A9521|nr:hypothetical protein [Comamonas terrigena]MDH0051492.1 hypothetical protein [Comamonas terrigena]MDH0513854.1 hypothetical protein [Comamonas terrigena]MDH1093418.1 hypothetical protein [Comamonas terrigena]MDH1503243.1 hypothetical protein [Comamonas terrigena]